MHLIPFLLQLVLQHIDLFQPFLHLLVLYMVLCLRLVFFYLDLFHHSLLVSVLLSHLLSQLILLRQGAAKLHDNVLQCFHFALVELKVGFRLFEETLELGHGVFTVHLRLVLDVAGTGAKTKG